MAQYGLENIRNLALLAHNGAGKTSLAEAILFNTKVINRLGKVSEGSTTSDYDPAEQKRGMSISLSMLPYIWQGNKINLMDTPGYPDFVGEVKSAIRVSEGAVIVVCASSGVEVGTEQVWSYCDAINLPRIAYINRMDRENVDFGDLDIIVSFEGNNKQEVKQQIIDSVTSLPSSLIVPFKSSKYTGRRYYNSGELISVLFPITGKPREYIQVDNIIALSEEEHNFKNNFLDLPAEKQGLLIGLVKTVLLEEDPKSVFRRLGINNLLPLQKGEEYEFNLSSVNLSLRKVKLENFKELSREIIWSSADWNLVERLLQNFNIDGTFEDLLNEIATKLKNPRSKKRVAGIFKGMVSVKSGEVGTPKGDNKERAIKLVTQRLSESKVKPLFNKNTSFSRFFAESEGVGFNLIVIFAGRFQPFHKGHAFYYERAKHEFPTAKFYIATASNTSKDAQKDPSKYPFDFNEKNKLFMPVEYLRMKLLKRAYLTHLKKYLNIIIQMSIELYF